MTSLRIAHISDLHFSKVTFHPLQFFSKRWIGNINLLVARKNEFIPERLSDLPSLFKELKVDLVIVSGDLTTTSLKQEFRLAQNFLQKIEQNHIPVYAIPGNHDHYTKSAYKKRLFYDFFKSRFSSDKEQISSFDLKEHKIAAKFLGSNWWLVALDTAISTPLLSSHGLFSSEDEDNLLKVLSLIPSDHNVLLVNHFPMFAQDITRKNLHRYEALQDLLRSFPNVKIYLHGHTHRHSIADLRPNGFPIVMESGSTSQREEGAWNLLDITPNDVNVTVYNFSQNWHPVRNASFSLEQ